MSALDALREDAEDKAAEHRKDALKTIDRAWHYLDGDGADPSTGQGFAAMAQAEATLALAAEVRALRLRLAQNPLALR